MGAYFRKKKGGILWKLKTGGGRSYVVGSDRRQCRGEKEKNQSRDMGIKGVKKWDQKLGKDKKESRKTTKISHNQSYKTMGRSLSRSDRETKNKRKRNQEGSPALIYTSTRWIKKSIRDSS